MAMGHVILREFHLDRTVPVFPDYVRKYTDLPMLVRLVRKDGRYVPDRLVRADDFADALDETNNPAWKTVALDDRAATRSSRSVRSASAGANKANGIWSSGAATVTKHSAALSLIDGRRQQKWRFPISAAPRPMAFAATEHPDS